MAASEQSAEAQRPARWPITHISAVVRSLRRRFQQRGAMSVRWMLRLTGAALAAYLGALLILGESRPVLAPLTALLIVQVTLVGTMADTLKRIASVVVGVSLAIAFSHLVSFHWWSLALIIAGSIAVGQLLRLGPHLLEVPISAMLVLAVGGAWDRIIETIVGATMGLLVNVVFPPAVHTRSAGASVDAYSRRLAALLDRAGGELAFGITADRATGWLLEARAISAEAQTLDKMLTAADESRRLNPRVLGTVDSGPGLRNGFDALEHSAVALRTMYRTISDRVREQPVQEQAEDAEMRAVFGQLMLALAEALRRFGGLVRAEAEGSGNDHGSHVASALDAVREGRALLADLLTVDAASQPQLWQLNGSLLACVERVLRELDLDERRRQLQQREREREMSRLSAINAVDRVVAVTRNAVADLPRRRPR
jgi:hypothetical protein